MDTQILSEDAAFPSSPKNSLIPFCHICKSSTSPFLPSCTICSKHYCSSCSSTIKSSEIIETCSKCASKTHKLSKSLAHNLEKAKESNQNTILETMGLEKTLQEIKSSLKRPQIIEYERYYTHIQQESSQAYNNLHRLSNEIKLLISEKNKLEVQDLEKEVKIGKLTQELIKNRAEALECKKNSNVIPPNYGELYLENEELKRQIKEIDDDHYVFTQQVVDGLELLKEQIDKERDENIDLRHIIKENCEKKNNEKLDAQKNRVREIEEELEDVKRNLQRMRSYKNDEEEFEKLNEEEPEGPESTPCKCIIS